MLNHPQPNKTDFEHLTHASSGVSKDASAYAFRKRGKLAIGLILGCLMGACALFIWTTSRPTIRCSNGTLRLSDFANNINDLISIRKYDEAMIQVSTAVSDQCKIDDGAYGGVAALRSPIEKLLSRAPVEYGYQLLGNIRNENLELRNLVLRNIKRSVLIKAADLRLLSYDDLKSVRYNTPSGLTESAVRLMIPSEAKMPNPDIGAFYARDGVTFLAKASNAEELFVGKLTGGKVRNLKEIGFDSVAYSSIDRPQIYFVLSAEKKILGLLTLEWGSIPEEISNETTCKAKYTFYTSEQSGFSPRYVKYDDFNCNEFGLVSSVDDTVTKSRILAESQAGIVKAVNEPPDLSPYVNFDRRDQSDRNIVDFMLNKQPVHNGSAYVITNFLVNKNIKRDSIGSFPLKKDQIRFDLNSSRIAELNASLEWAFAGRQGLLEPIKGHLDEISLLYKKYKELNQEIERLRKDQLDSGPRPTVHAFTLVREAGPQDDVNLTGNFLHVYLAVDRARNVTPIVIKSEIDLLSRNPYIEAPLMETDEIVRIYQGGFWRSLKVYEYSNALVEAISLDNKLNDMMIDERKVQKQLDLEISNLFDDMHKVGVLE